MSELPAKIDGNIHRNGTEAPLPMPYAVNLFAATYQHAQAGIYLQTNIFRYIHLIRPAYRISNDLAPSFQDAARARIEKYLQYAQGREKAEEKQIVLHSAYIDDDKEKDLDDRIRSFINILNTPGGMSHLEAVSSIAEGIVEVDYTFLVDQQGRVRHSPNPEQGYNPKLDPWLSHVFYFGIERHATGFAELDQMYADVVTRLRNGLFGESRVVDGQFTQVERVYKEKHPEKADVNIFVV